VVIETGAISRILAKKMCFMLTLISLTMGVQRATLLCIYLFMTSVIGSWQDENQAGISHNCTKIFLWHSQYEITRWQYLHEWSILDFFFRLHNEKVPSCNHPQWHPV